MPDNRLIQDPSSSPAGAQPSATPAHRTGRRVAWWVGGILGGLVGLALLLWLGVTIYLSTAAGKGRMAKVLSGAIGLPVEVSDVSLGLHNSSVKFRVLDPNAAGTPDAEVLSVESARADVSLLGIVTGHTSPRDITLRDAALTLRLDPHGKVLTTMPSPSGGGTGPAPTLRLEDSKVTIRQEGRPEFVMPGVNLTATPEGDQVRVDGTMGDQTWGSWKVNGTVDRKAGTLGVDLVSDDAPLVTERLRSIPFVPLSTWRIVHPDGRGAATVHLGRGSDKKFVYDAQLRPAGAAFTFPDAHVTLTNVTGMIEVKHSVLSLADAKGTVAGGSVTLAGSWDFRPNAPDPSVADFHITATNLDLEKTPPQWGLRKERKPGQTPQPGQVELESGQLSGKAHLHLRVFPDEHVDATGSTGSGVLKNATVAIGSLTSKADDIPIHLGQTTGGLQLQRSAAPASPEPPPPPGPTMRRQPARDDAALLVALLVQPPAAPAQPAPKAAPKAAPPTLDATLTLRDVDIAQLFEQLKIKLPYRLGGKVTAKVTVAVPVESAASASAYHFTGSLTSPELRVEDLTVRDFSANLTYGDGKLTVTGIRGQVPQPGGAGSPGEFVGTASAAISPPGPVSANLTLTNLPVGDIARVFSRGSIEARGTVTGKAEFSTPYERVEDPTAWTGGADVRADDLVLAGRPITGFRLNATLAGGTLTLKEAAATIGGIPVTASGTLGLTAGYKFDAHLKTSPTDLADFRKLIPEADLPLPMEGLLTIDAKVAGTLSPLAFTASGHIAASKLTLGKTPANHLDLNWEVTQDHVKISDLKADLFAGSLTGRADIPFSPLKGGSFELVFQNLDAAAAEAFVPDFPVRVSGAVTGHIAGTINPAKEGQSRVGDLDVKIKSKKLTVQGLPAEALEGTATIKNGSLDYALTGKTLGGSFDLKGSYPGPKKAAPAAPAAPPGVQPVGLQKQGRGSLRVRGINLALIGPEMRMPSLAPLRGIVDVTFDYADDLSEGSGRVLVRGLGWGQAETDTDLTGVLILSDGVVRLVEFGGPLAGGWVRLGARVPLHHPARNEVRAEFARLNPAQLLAPFPALRGVIRGHISGRVGGSVGADTRLHGTVHLERGTAGGVGVSNLRIPFRLQTGAGRTELSIREATTTAGTGSAQIQATVVWATTMSVDAHARFINVPIATIAPSLREETFLGSGRLTGRLDLEGRDVRSADDLTGSLVAVLNGTSVKEIPLLDYTVPYLNPLGVVRPFETGDIRATLSRGLIRVQRIALANPTAQVLAEGTVTVGGRLDLAVVAHTGTIGPTAPGLRTLGLRLPNVGPIPLGLIQDVSMFLSNRTVRLTVSGTVSHPAVVVNVRALLSEEAVRFFLSQYVLPAEVSDLLGIGGLSGVIGGSSSSNR